MKKSNTLLACLLVALCVIAWPGGAFAEDTKISELTELEEAPAEGDMFPFNDGGTTKSISTLNMMGALEAALTDFAIHADNLPDLSSTYLPLAGGTMTDDLLITNGVDVRVSTTTDAHEWCIQAYDVDGTAWVDMLCFANSNTPTGTLSNTWIMPKPFAVPSGTDTSGDITSAGHVVVETDDNMVGFYGSAAKYIPLSEQHQMTIFEPDQVNDELPVFHCDSTRFPFGCTVTKVSIQLPADAEYSIEIENWDGDPPAADGFIEENLATASDDNYASTTSIDNATLGADDWIFLDIPATDVDWIIFTVIVEAIQGD